MSIPALTDEVANDAMEVSFDDVPDSAAACNDGTGTLTSLFFSEDLLDIARAKHLCSTCPLQSRCLTDALERREPWGVWGGEIFERGVVVARKRPRGRPRKTEVAA